MGIMKTLFLFGFLLVLASSAPMLDAVKQQKNHRDVEKQDEKQRVVEALTKFLATKTGEELLDNLEKQSTAYRSLRLDDDSNPAKKRGAGWFSKLAKKAVHKVGKLFHGHGHGHGDHGQDQGQDQDYQDQGQDQDYQ